MFEKCTNLFIHGTDSSVLAQLVHTDFTLFSPIWMMDKFQIAPFGGEITGGGLDTVRQESRLAFGRLRGLGYDLNRVIEGYALRKPLQERSALIQLARKSLKHGSSCLFSNINLLLIYIARLKQVGIDNSEWISEVELEELYRQTQATLQFFYLILLLGSKINPDYELLDNFDTITKENTIDAIFTHLNTKEILERIITAGIDIKSIYENPSSSKSELEQVVKLLELPRTLAVRSRYSSKTRNVVLDETIIFKLTGT